MSSADTFCKHLDQDQARQNVGPDLGPNCLIDTLIVLPKELFEKNNFKKSQQTIKNHEKLPSRPKVKLLGSKGSFLPVRSFGYLTNMAQLQRLGNFIVTSQSSTLTFVLLYFIKR